MRAQADGFGPQDFRDSISFTGSLVLHAGIVAAFAAYAFVLSALHPADWGNSATQGAIQATLVSSAPAIPLPSPQQPTDNVLATETPSPAPAPPVAKAPPAPDEQAVPIPIQQPEKPKPIPKTPPAPPAPPVKELAKVTPGPPPPKHPQPMPKQDNRAAFGEAAPTNLPRSVQTHPGNQPIVSTNTGDFGSRFGYYMQIIKNKTSQNWYRQEVDPRSALGHQAIVGFDVHRDGSVSNARLEQSSGIPALDSSGLRAVQRVDTYGPLPSAYNGSFIHVSYTFDYAQP